MGSGGGLGLSQPVKPLGGFLSLLALPPLAPPCPRAFAPTQNPQHTQQQTVAPCFSHQCVLRAELLLDLGLLSVGEGLAVQDLTETCSVCVCGRCSKMSFHSDTKRLILAIDLSLFLAHLERKVNPHMAAGLVP